MHRRQFLLASLFLGACSRRRPTVLAAGSLEPWLRGCAAEFGLDFSYGGSHSLVEQARRGAPVELLLLADLPRTPLAGFAAPLPFAGNQLALVARGRSCTLSELATARVAMGDPDLAPVGVYGREALQAAGQWAGVQKRLVLTRDDRSSLLMLESGHVELAIVYASDVVGRAGVGKPTVLSGHRPVRYFEVQRQQASPEVASFRKWLHGAQGAASLVRFGFTPVS
jgi:molybdate transport system substrate-binding protein